MDTKVIGFEYERMFDGSLRLRFLNREGRILGQQVVSAEAMLPLQVLVGIAVVTLKHVDSEALLEAWQLAGLERRPRLRGHAIRGRTSPGDPDPWRRDETGRIRGREFLSREKPVELACTDGEPASHNW